ncbi:uncharacterized protein FRV6_06880 [Fusarium oxysporum]|uniref:Uncharacterized protein n=1 Tax=Fusarium oxysporum TaxID=5507 RepID=A0A2H3T209_FUSOX|nr:uncharacterized protein FRV6_06880 [Fusarium oxysporum]
MPCRLTDSAEEYTCGLGFFLANESGYTA